MADHGFTPENLLRTLPEVLREDEKMHALAQAIAEALSAERTAADGARMYANIAALPGELCDILAHDFKVDWWDADMTVLYKRRVLAASWAVHRTIGTVGAVKTAAQAIYPVTGVLEWFEYGGEPYGYMLELSAADDGVIDPESLERFINRLSYYKNLRSHLDGVFVRRELRPAVAVAGLLRHARRVDIYTRNEGGV